MAGKNKTYELMLKIGGKVDGSLKTACSTADKNLAALGKTAKTAGKIAAGAMVAAATAVATLGTAAVKSAAEYEAQLANVSTLLTGTEAEVAARTAEIGDQVLEISNRTGVATADLTDGMYQVVSAFGDSADAAAILETAAKSAAAGNATTTDSINLLSAVTKGYGDTSAEAVQQAADLAFATVRLGQTSFPELAAGMGKVIPLASTLGLEQEQLWGAMATLTGVTGSTAEVVTQMKATMQAFLSPSKNMQAALKNMGYESGQALLESKGLQGSLDALKDAVGGNELAFAGLFSSVEAQTAVLAMAGNQAENLTSKTAEMYEATGAANTAFERQTNNLKYDIKMIKNLGANFLTQLGTNILPYVREFAEAALPVASEALEKIGSYMTGTIIPAAETAVKWISEHRTLILALAAGIATAVAAYKAYKVAITAYNAVMAVYKVVTAASATGTFTLAGAMTALLRDALQPNLVQTIDGTPCLMHGGPFANIAHGCNSIMATQMALALGDYAITEAGFGADLGAEKFLDIKCRMADLQPSAVVVVATVRALKHHGGVAKADLGKEDLAALERGLPNLLRHVENITTVFRLPCVVAINRFPLDTEAELALIADRCRELGVHVALSEVWAKGGEGGRALAEEVVRLCEQPNQFQQAYPLDCSIEEKLRAIVTKIYRGKDVVLTPNAQKQARQLTEQGFGGYPICMAKTQYSFSDNQALLGAPEDFTVTVRNLKVSAGAGFIVALTGDILTMPGLPKVPAAEKIDVDETGKITGLF